MPDWGLLYSLLGFRLHPEPDMLRAPIILAIALLASATPASAQQSAASWPSRPITLVAPFAAGGGNDVLGRIVAQPLGEILKQPVIIENVPGAGGMTGSSRVAKAAPDG